MRIRAKLAAAAVLAVAALTLMPGVASAHEEKHVGPYTLAVGFGTEPDAYAGYPEQRPAALEQGREAGRRPRRHAEGGGRSSAISRAIPCRSSRSSRSARSGSPGDYRAFFVPSQPGDYTFHITGTIQGTKVDESFTSGPKTFASVQDISSATFPQVQAPTNADLATRIQTGSDRTSTALTAATAAATSARAAAEQCEGRRR